MKKILLYLFLTVSSFSNPYICDMPFGGDPELEYGWVYREGSSATSAVINTCESPAYPDAFVGNNNNYYLHKEYTHFVPTGGTCANDSSVGKWYHTSRTYDCESELACLAPKVINPITDICEEPPVSPCPTNQQRLTPESECTCIPPLYAEYDVSSNLFCVMPDCPPTYGNNVPPLPLFLQTDNVNNCNFFALGDGAVLDLNGLICCYGQEDTSPPEQCAINEMAINGECYPIVPREEVPELNTTCPKGSYWSINSESCLEWFPENNSTNPDGSPSATAGDTDGDGSLDDVGQDGSYEGDGDYGIDMDGAESALSNILTSYVLIDLPVSISSNCGDEFKKTFTLPVTGQSYSIDVAQHISTIEEYAPMIKAIILFMFSLSGVLIVLSGNKE